MWNGTPIALGDARPLSDFNRITGTPLLGSGELNSGDTEFSNMDAPVSDDSGVADYSPSEMSKLTGDFIRKTGTPLWGSGESISGDVQFSDMDVPVSNDSGDFCENPEMVRRPECPLMWTSEHQTRRGRGQMGVQSVAEPTKPVTGDIRYVSKHKTVGFGR